MQKVSEWSRKGKNNLSIISFKLKNNIDNAERTEVIIMKSLAQLGLFAGGVLFGTAGIKILSSKDAKKAYTHTTAAVLRAKECVMGAATKIKENADDILADSKKINEERAAAEEVIEDAAGETA